MRDKQIEDLKDYKYGFSTDIESFKAPKGLNEEVIRIAKGSNLNKPETQFQFHNVLNKKGFFQQIQNDGIKKGATIKFEDIELEYK